MKTVATVSALLCALAVLWAPARGQAQECNFETTLVIKGKTAQECEAGAQKFSGSCWETTMGMVMVSAAVSECQRKRMVQALDPRLLKLKKENGEQFKKEMALQKTFNEAVNAYCGLYASCDGTMYRPMAANCPASFYTWRASQAKAIEKGSLELRPKTKELKGKVPEGFQTFADGLCAMPKEVWKGGKVPAGCKSLVLRSLQDFESSLGGDVCDLGE